MIEIWDGLGVDVEVLVRAMVGVWDGLNVDVGWGDEVLVSAMVEVAGEHAAKKINPVNMSAILRMISSMNFT